MNTRESIELGTAVNDGQGDTLRQGGSKIEENFIKLWLKHGGDSDVMSGVMSFGSNSIQFSNGSFTTSLTADSGTTNRTINFTDNSGNVVLDSATQTLTNKTFTNPILDGLRINDVNDSFYYSVVAGDLSSNENINLPDLSDSDTFVFQGVAQTLTNKTIDSAILNTPLVSDILDANGNNVIELGATGSAVNNISISNAATSNSPSIDVLGSDSDINLTISTKNGGSVSHSKLSYQMTTVSTDGQTPKNYSYIDCNKGTALALSLADGTQPGEVKIYSNRGSGTATITPTNFANGTDFALAQNECAEVIWDGNNWFLKSNQSVVTVS